MRRPRLLVKIELLLGRVGFHRLGICTVVVVFFLTGLIIDVLWIRSACIVVGLAVMTILVNIGRGLILFGEDENACRGDGHRFLLLFTHSHTAATKQSD